MTAWRGFRFVYGRLVAPLDEDTRIEVDALLGDPVAEMRLQQMRREAVMAIGGEIG